MNLVNFDILCYFQTGTDGEVHTQPGISLPSPPSTHDSGFDLADDADVDDELLVLTDNQLIFEPHTPPSDDGITVTIHAEVTSTGEADRDNVILTTQLENGN